jgi:hypothetical protein
MIDYVVWQNKHIALASTSTLRSFGYMAVEIILESKQKHACVTKV